ncbi:arylsulfotransferase family protein [Paroceanicella profunda]|uniref:arylsulfotransferase family protein n=1 Tax=Paroceanicella profunda TaxID=2579971 RepID=UPI001EF15F96|nr:arylsulfotransferase family protein [Paroceanicella profunda]
MTIGNVFPGPEIRRAYEGGMALYEKATMTQDVHTSDLWFPERSPGKGVTVPATERSQGGVTLYTTGDQPSAYLIDMDGQVLHQWTKPFSQVWSADWGGVADPQPDQFVYFRHAHVYPNGDLLATYEGVGDTPYGYGLVKLDRNSNVVWRYPGRAHHQFSVAPDGKIYTLTHEIVDDVLPSFEHLESPRLEDFLVVLAPDGEELQKIRLLPAMAASKYRHILYATSGFALGDPLHANAVKYITAAQAANFPWAKEGDILFSFREANGVAVMDPKTGDVHWATRGPWLGQHDADLLDNGHLLLFDNYANYQGEDGSSRVLEVDPKTMAIVWQYAGTKDHPLESRIRSDQQRLANGNTVITESNGGRILEVTPEGEIVWEFMNPVRAAFNGQTIIPIVAWAERLDPATLDPTLLVPTGRQASLTRAHTGPASAVPEEVASESHSPASAAAEAGPHTPGNAPGTNHPAGALSARLLPAGLASAPLTDADLASAHRPFAEQIKETN